MPKTCCGRKLKPLGDIGWWKWFSCPKCGSLWMNHRGSGVWKKQVGC